MKIKILLFAVFTVVATATFSDMITQSSSSASTVSQNAGANNNVVVTTNTINSTVVAGNSSTFPFTGNVSVMVGIKPDQGKSPQYDNPNAINLNYQIGNWTWSLNGATEFTGMINSSYGNAMGAGNQNTMLNTWGFTGGYNFQNGLTTSMNVSYLNWRSQSSSPAAGIFPVLVTGYQLAPTMTYVNGNSTYALAMYYQVLGSSNGILAVSSSAGFPPNGITGTWNGQNGESFSIFPMYTNQVSTAFSYSTGVQIQQANDNYLILTQAVDNDSNNNIILHPIMLSYNVASIPGLNLNLDTRYYYNNTVKNDPMQTNIGAIAGSTRVCIYPGIAYTKSITSSLSWVTNAQVYGKWYTNNMNGQIGQTPNGKGNISTNYGGQIYSGFNYSF